MRGLTRSVVIACVAGVVGMLGACRNSSKAAADTTGAYGGAGTAGQIVKPDTTIQPPPVGTGTSAPAGAAAAESAKALRGKEKRQ